MSERRCPACKIPKDEDLFRLIDGIKVARDCIECEDARIRRASIKRVPIKTPTVSRARLADAAELRKVAPELANKAIEANREFPGLDMDAIYNNPKYQHLRNRG